MGRRGNGKEQWTDTRTHTLSRYYKKTIVCKCNVFPAVGAYVEGDRKREREEREGEGGKEKRHAEGHEKRG